MQFSHNARIAFQPVYESILLDSKQGKHTSKPIPPYQAIHVDQTKYPLVLIYPSGDIIGPYDSVGKYAQSTDLTGRRKKNAPTTIEVHHLLEDRCMKHFGITKSEGLCVTLEQTDHAYFSAELPQHLKRGKNFMADIDVVYDAHATMYKEAGIPEWLPLIKLWLKSVRGRIKSAYTSGKIPGVEADDSARIEKFLNSL